MIWGKVICGILGLLLAGPIGAIVGLVIGQYFDISFAKNKFGFDWGISAARLAQARSAFFDATFSVMGHVAKSDGRVTEREIQAATEIMRRMMLNPQQRQRAIHLFNTGKESGFDIEATLLHLREACFDQRMLLRMFIEIQIQVANAEGFVSERKRQILEHICEMLGFAPSFSQFGDYQQQQQQQQQYQYQHRYRPPPRYTPPKKDPYKILGISNSATNAEIKRAYRKLMSQHHPDKLVSKGLPEEMMKIATEKTQEIQKAYDEIMKTR